MFYVVCVSRARARRESKVAVNGRRKGNQFENETCFAVSRWLAPEHTPEAASVYDLPFRRRSTSIMPLEGYWHGEGDILHKPLPGIVCPFSFEAKNQEGWELDGIFSNAKWPVWLWWSQCQAQAKRAKLIPLMIFTRNRRNVLAMLREGTAKCLHVKPASASLLNVETPSGDNVVIVALSDLTRVSLHLVRALRPATK